MTTYHPPMTGLEAEMEEEIANQAHLPNEALQRAQQLREQETKTKIEPPKATEMDRETEDAMQLGQ